MPKEGESSTSGKNPLKRGDACLYCRKRRIRCSAEKPTCQHCKGKRECVYDNGKPVSRVRQLEDKVAELEEMLKRESGGGAQSIRRASDEGISPGYGGGDGGNAGLAGNGTTQPQLQHHSSDQSTASTSRFVPRDNLPQSSAMSGFNLGSLGGTSMDGIQGFDINMLQQSFGDITGSNPLSNDFLAFGSSMFGPSGSDDSYNKIPDVVADSLPSDPGAMFDFSTLDPNFMSLVNSFDNTFQQPQSFPPIQQQPQQQQLPTAPSFRQPAYTSQPQPTTGSGSQSNESSTGLTPFLNQDFTPSNSGPSPPISTGIASGADLAPTPGQHFDHLSKTVNYNINGGVFPTAAEANGSADQSLNNRLPQNSFLQNPTSFSSAFRAPTDTRGGQGMRIEEEGSELVGGWFDANDLPRVARDHL